jgi:hypothetical protein
MKKYFFASLFLMVVLVSCNTRPKVTLYKDEELSVVLNDVLNNTLAHDGFPPPVASRIYAYANIAAYEGVRFGHMEHPSFINKLKGFGSYEDKGTEASMIDNRVIMTNAFCEVAKKLVYRANYLDTIQKKLLANYKDIIGEDKFKYSMEQSVKVIDAISARIKADNYAKTRNMPKYVPGSTDADWQPTGPTFGDAIEPYWGTIMPFVMDTLLQVDSFITFDKNKGSACYNEAYEVYEIKNGVGTEQKLIADFWDCNPQKTNIRGHIMYKTRQLNPGGHWVCICGTLCKQEKLDMISTARVHAKMTMAVADGFINCWSEKYRLKFIRPETYIQRYIDKAWQPLLETPLFPEYPSGHGVISGAASAVLIYELKKDNINFIDSAEVPFDRQPRNFTSISAAAEEAAVSRMYGGIHYRSSCNSALRLGRKVADKVNATFN